MSRPVPSNGAPISYSISSITIDAAVSDPSASLSSGDHFCQLDSKQLSSPPRNGIHVGCPGLGFLYHQDHRIYNFLSRSTGVNNIDDYAWYGNMNGGSATTNATTNVSSLALNELGLNDMSGNAWEWCRDWLAMGSVNGFLADYRGSDPGSVEILKGGNWGWSASVCGPGQNNNVNPGAVYSGFRVVRK